MLTDNTSVRFLKILFFIFCFYTLQYVLRIFLQINISYSLYIDLAIYLLIWITYLVKYRRDNLLCFELFFLPIAFIGIFFKDLFFLSIADSFSFQFIEDKAIALKSRTIQLMANYALLIGTVKANKKYCRFYCEDLILSHSKTNYNIFIQVLTCLLLLLILYDYQSGVFSSWFYYSNADWMDVDERNKGFGHLSCLLIAAAIVDIIRLRDLGVSSFLNYLKKCNKLFIFEWIFISALLFVSGNRNEMLLIVIPLVVAYTKCIQRLSNKLIIAAMIVGVILMAAVGFLRQEATMDIGLLAFTRDFAPLSYNTEMLIEYADKNGYTMFVDVPAALLSGIPKIGPALVPFFSDDSFIASATLTTEAAGTHSGMGTSLIGDLYYTAGPIWVVIFMCLLGYIMAKLYYSGKVIDPFSLAIYSYMVANAVYYNRSSWIFPVTVIEYICIIILLGKIVFKKR